MHAISRHVNARPRCIGDQTASSRRHSSNLQTARLRLASKLVSLQAVLHTAALSSAKDAIKAQATAGTGHFQLFARSKVACTSTSSGAGGAAGAGVPESPGSPGSSRDPVQQQLDKLEEESAALAAQLTEAFARLLEAAMAAEPNPKVISALEKHYGALSAKDVRLDNMRAALLAKLSGPASRNAAASKVAAGFQTGITPTDQTTDRTLLWLRKFLGRQAAVPALDALGEYLFQGLSDPLTRPRLPVPDGTYAALVAEEPELQDWLEPVSLSGADGISAVIFTALMQREWMQPGAELNLAGMVDKVLWSVMEAAIWHLGGMNWMNRRDKTESSLTLPDLRPDFLLLALTSDASMAGMVARMIMKGEDKAYDNLLGLAVRELASKMSSWAAVYFGKVPYLPCYAAAGLTLQLCCLPSSGRAQGEAVLVGPQINLKTRVGRCTAIHVALRLVPVLMGIAQLLPTNSAPLAAKRFHPPATYIEYSTDYVVKSIDLNLSQLVRGGFDAAQANFMQGVFDAAAQCPHLIHAQSHVHVRNGMYEVGLTPVGYPLRDEYAPEKESLLEAVRCILFALVWLHSAGIGHGDLRWPNIIERMPRQEPSDDGASDASAGGPEQGMQAAAAQGEDKRPTGCDLPDVALRPEALAIIPPGLHAAACCPGKYFVADLEAAVRLGTYQSKERVGARQAWDKGAALDSKSHFREQSDLYMLGRMMQKAGVKEKDDDAYAFMNELMAKKLNLREALQHPYVLPAA